VINNVMKKSCYLLIIVLVLLFVLLCCKKYSNPVEGADAPHIVTPVSHISRPRPIDREWTEQNVSIAQWEKEREGN
jgi:hypothetical protein